MGLLRLLVSGGAPKVALAAGALGTVPGAAWSRTTSWPGRGGLHVDDGEAEVGTEALRRYLETYVGAPYMYNDMYYDDGCARVAEPVDVEVSGKALRPKGPGEAARTGCRR